MKTYKQRTDNILKKAEKQKSIRKTATISAISATACAAVVALSCVLFVPFPTQEPAVNAYKNDEYFSVIKSLNARFENKVKGPTPKNNFEKWTWGLRDLFSDGLKTEPSGGWDDVIWDTDTALPEWDVEYDGSTSGGADTSDENYKETTDNQVAGVIEGDLFKSTDTHIFYLSKLDADGRTVDGYGTLRVYTIAGENSRLVHEYTIQTNGVRALSAQPEIYLSKDGKTLTIVNVVIKMGENTKRFTEVTTLDVSNPTQIKEIGRKYLSGQYVSSRFVDGKLMVVNNFNVTSMPDFDDYTSYIPQYGDDVNALDLVDGEDIIVPETITSTKHTVVMELNQATGEIEDCMALYCYSADLYVSQDHMYLTREYINATDFENMTEITCISYGNEGFAKVGNVTVEGKVLNQYSMDEYNGIFRVVTSVYRPVADASLYCIDMQTWEIIGSAIEFSEDGEDVQSVRFDGDKAYVCTAEIITFTDPVYAFNLSDPTNITYKDTGEIKGYSTSLIQYENGYLLGIGVNDRNSLKIEIYEETDNGVQGVHTYEPDFADFSRVYKSYYINREKGLVGLAVRTSSGGENVYEYRLLYFDEYGIEELAVVPFECSRSNFDYSRATIIDGYLYVFYTDFYVVKIS